jgi:hypothetical protein
MALLRPSVRNAAITSVSRPEPSARGTSRTGSTASSAASGSSSMPRKNQMAKGSAVSTPSGPCGRNAPWPLSAAGAMSSACDMATCGSAPSQNTTKMPSANTVMASVARNDTDAPAMLSPTNSA